LPATEQYREGLLHAAIMVQLAAHKRTRRAIVIMRSRSTQRHSSHQHC
jgi:hypothetical protein